MLLHEKTIYNSGRFIHGNATFEGMDIQIEQREYGTIILSFDNPTSTEMNIGGWSSSQQVCLTTTTGEYWYDFNEHMGYTIPAHSTVKRKASFQNVSGDYISVKIDCIQTLVNGLPTFGISSIVEIPIRYTEGEVSENGTISILDFWDKKIGIAAAICAVICIILARIIANAMSPKKTAKVVVAQKNIVETTHYQNNMVTGTTCTYYITFVTEESEKYKMNVSYKIYKKIYAGDVGILIRKGSQFVAFHSLNTYGEQHIAE